MKQRAIFVLAVGFLLAQACRPARCGGNASSPEQRMSSYFTEFGSPAKESRVAASSRTYGALTRVVPLPNEKFPSFVLIDASGKNVVVRDGNELLRVDHGSGNLTPRFALGDLDHAVTLALDWGVVIGSVQVRWDGGPPPGYELSNGVFNGMPAQGQAMAARLENGRWTVVGQIYHGNGGRDALVAQSGPAGNATITPWAYGLGDMQGGGAIGRDGRVIVVVRDGAFHVLSAEGDNQGNASILLEGALKGTGDVYSVSVIEPGYAVLAARDPKAAPLGFGYGVDVARWKPPTDPWAKWTTVLERLDAQGRVRFATDVAFEAFQPPIDGAGRIYVVGRGVAAVDDETGRLLWQQRSERPVQATAFEDGTLAVAVGASLRIVDRDGTIRQELRTSEGETITTPPAIACDGSVWVATQKAVYVAR